MKRVVSTIAVVLGLVLLPALAAQAQSVKVSVPFDFTAGLASLPAGDYTVGKPGIAQHVLQIQSTDGKCNAFVMTQSAETTKGKLEGKLVFNRYGNQYFLSQVWAPGNSIGHQLRMSKQERQIAKNAAKPKVEILTAKK